jgi:hypothetical protein
LDGKHTIVTGYQTKEKAVLQITANKRTRAWIACGGQN